MKNLMLLAVAVSTISLSCGKNSPEGSAARDVTYSDGTTQLKGFLVYDARTNEKRPGVIVVPEWWGIVDYTRMRARMLADLGYVAMVIDMYGHGKTAPTRDSAAAYATAIMKDPELVRARFMAAYDLLKREPAVDSTRIAAIGYCLGGTVVLQMARAGAPLAGAVSFHTALGQATAVQPGEAAAKVLVLNGAADPVNPPQVVRTFKQQMDSSGLDYSFVDFPGAKHSFTNPASDSIARLYNDASVAYHPQADRESWTDMREFLHQVFSERK